ncbi:ASCH domain-containing protein [Lentiprolixibacter aurantiacus]|uniref:ASCH domain-containing protein n=1 Tax=Lentiprolixibacter aurantiacus TaxID=2993939 RepID=A0AAE3MJF2_9FLAO|nr:ASCH domain-containing protein [Lentiprolixibacter aurantiacus]MCX2718706.1 ASCH domain-containing protein [Lentiprolixibacter aurantiacus]
MDNASARNMWGDFLDTHLEYAFAEEPRVERFFDNEKDCQASIKLVLSGTKRATSHSLLGLQLRGERLPKIGDFTVLTDWNGKARCIVRTAGVKLKPFFSIPGSYAKLEGEGDKSLEYWKKMHWEFYKRELEPFGREPRESMIVVCEVFEKVFPA